MSNDPYWERTKYNPNLRRDALYVAQSGGNDAGKILWGGLAVLGAVFWPCAVHGTGGVVAKVAWWGFLGLCAVVTLAVITVRQGSRR
jgi:hypothetical protein